MLTHKILAAILAREDNLATLDAKLEEECTRLHDAYPAGQVPGMFEALRAFLAAYRGIVEGNPPDVIGYWGSPGAMEMNDLLRETISNLAHRRQDEKAFHLRESIRRQRLAKLARKRKKRS